MADLRNYQNRGAQTQSGAVIDEGLRTYMLKVYNLMAMGLAITGLAAYFTFALAFSNGSVTSFGMAIYGSPLRYVVMFAPLAMVFYLSFRIHKMSVSAAQLAFWVYAGLMGLSLSSIFILYTQGSIVQTFFVTAASFGALSLYGYVTRRDLSAMGSFLVMGLFGLIIASLVQLFLQSQALNFAISVVGVLIFAGLTAWDTQKIKESYYESDSADMAGRKAIMGALQLYLDFLNLFLFLLRFMGNNRN
nr:Bax inhibitor-1/YccA family protein [uncultured Gellertiella sp.]